MTARDLLVQARCFSDVVIEQVLAILPDDADADIVLAAARLAQAREAQFAIGPFRSTQ